jgi:hypothetical protein
MNSPTPEVEVSHDTAVTYLTDDLWRIDVTTHIFVNGVEVMRGMVSDMFNGTLNEKRWKLSSDVPDGH